MKGAAVDWMSGSVSAVQTIASFVVGDDGSRRRLSIMDKSAVLEGAAGQASK